MKLWEATLLCFLAGCATDTMYRESGVSPRLRAETVALAPAQFLHQMQAHPQEEWFEQNSTVGFMLHEGGFVTDKGMGGYTHTKTVSIFENPEYEATIGTLVEGVIRRELQRRGTAPLDVAVKVPEATWVGTTLQEPGDGHDNVNIPYRELVMPSRLDLAGEDANGAALPNGVSAILVPVVTYYYAHNAGWYYGQTWGSTAGCRARVALAIYDDRGRLQSTREFDTRYLSGREYQPNGAEILQLRKQCHEQIEAATIKTLKQAW
ncbi:MAG: hypothetical protein ACPHRO_09580 [Nannocystaceae bacterium]